MRIPSFLAAMLLATAAQAHEFHAGDITVGHPYSYPVGPSAPTSLGYLTITNGGTEPDRLIGVEAPGPFASVTLHRTELGADGIARMLHDDAVAIAPGETVIFGPQGRHIMFTGLGGDPWQDGEKIPATLIFEHAGRLDVILDVQPRGDGKVDHGMMEMGEPDMGEMDHSGMDHDAAAYPAELTAPTN